MDTNRITLSLDKQSDGSHVSPERVRLGDLTRFSDDVRALLQGDGNELDANELEVSIIKGSLAIQTYPLQPAPKLFADLKSLGNGSLLKDIDLKRRRVIERWQKSAFSVAGLIYKISAPFLDEPIVVSFNSRFHLVEDDAWVNVERYIVGEIQEVGGSKRPNAHVKLPGGEVLTVLTDKDILRKDERNRLYKNSMLRIRAEYNLSTKKLRNAHLIEFLDYAQGVDQKQLERMRERGAQAWKNIPDASAWVEELRGNKN